MDLIAIPTIGVSPYASALYRTLVQSLFHQPYYILIMDNTGMTGRVGEQIEEAKAFSFVDHVSTHGLNISQQWRMAFEFGQLMGAPRVHVLNDDIVLNSMSVPAMTMAMESNRGYGAVGYDYFPEQALEEVHFTGMKAAAGSYRLGGIGGFAFCVDTRCPPPDPQFEWWGGDDDWFWQILDSGFGLAVAKGIPVRHPEPETSAITRPELGEAKGRDHARLLAKWGNAW